MQNLLELWGRRPKNPMEVLLQTAAIVRPHIHRIAFEYRANMSYSLLKTQTTIMMLRKRKVAKHFNPSWFTQSLSLVTLPKTIQLSPDQCMITGKRNLGSKTTSPHYVLGSPKSWARPDKNLPGVWPPSRFVCSSELVAAISAAALNKESLWAFASTVTPLSPHNYTKAIVLEKQEQTMSSN